MDVIRRVCIVAAVSAVGISLTLPASADVEGDAWSTHDGVEYTVRDGNTVVGRRVGRRGPITRYIQVQVVGDRGVSLIGDPNNPRTRTAVTYNGREYVGLPSPGPEYQAYVVVRDGVVGSVVWRLPPVAATPAQRAAIDDIVRGMVPAPDASVRAEPGNRGLTGLETRFWVDGLDAYNSGSQTVVRNVLGSTITVQLTSSDASWTFGDGKTFVTHNFGAGQDSIIRHTYEKDSNSEEFAVRITVSFQPRYRIANGPWFELADIDRTASLDYPVIESRSQLRTTNQ